MARTTRRPPTFTAAPVTASPARTSTGALSPVSRLRSTALVPSTTSPSVATFSPGRTTNRSPTRSAAIGTRVSTPSRSTAASRAPRVASARIAEPARVLARASAYRPASRNVVSTAPTSTYRSPPRTSATRLQPVATVTPKEISVSIVVAPCRRFTSAARWKGQAAQVTTGRASATASHGSRPGKPIVSTSNGIVAATATASRGARGAGSRTTPAVYPVASTTRTRSASATDGGYDTCAVSVARLTVARTPSMRLCFFSTRVAQEAHVIPPT